MLKMTSKSAKGKFLQRFIPARIIFVIMGFFGFNLAYAFKVTLSMSIIAMTNKTSSALTTVSNNTATGCYDSSTLTGVETLPGVKLDWNQQIKSQVLSAFFYGYILTQIPAGIMATKYGGKRIYGTAILITAVLSIVGPFAAKADYRLFMAVQIGQGLAEGVLFPCMSTLIAQWMPKMERTRGTTIIHTGMTIGTVITLPLAALLSKSHFMGSWEATFYLFGIAGIIWFILWTCLVYESPEQHPYISQKEFDYILANDGGLKSKMNLVIPYRQMFTSVPVIALILTHFGQSWGVLTILNLMPTYMNNVLHMSINENMLISGLPFLGQAIFGWTASWISDKLRQSGRFEITTIRKANSFIAYIPSAICLAAIPLVGCNPTLSSILFVLALTFNGSSFSGLSSTHVDLAPEHAGTLFGITNSIGNIPGFLATIVAGRLTKNGQTVQNWASVFYISAGAFVAITFIYCFFCSAREQSWGRSGNKQENTIENKQDKQEETVL